MTLGRCPRCRLKLAEPEPDRCVCGEDLAEARREIERYMQPPAGAPGLPLTLVKRLPRKDRTQIATAIEAAKLSARRRED